MRLWYTSHLDVRKPGYQKVEFRGDSLPDEVFLRKALPPDGVTPPER